MCQNHSRRSFLGKVGACAGYVSAANMMGPLSTGYAWAASSCTPQNKVLVHVFLDGGMDSANFLVPRNIQSYMDKRPNIRITNPLVIDSRYGLNPALTNIHSHMLAGRAAVVNKIGYPQPTRSHEDSKNVYARAIRASGGANTGWAGRFGDLYCAGNPNVTSVFSFRGRVKEVSAQSFVATTSGSLGSYGYQNDNDTNDSRYRRMIMQINRQNDGANNEQAISVNNSWNVIDNSVTTLQTVNSSYTSPITYASDGLSQRFRDAAKLIKSQENPSIILLGQGGYDTHGEELTAHTNLFGQLDRALGSFMADLSNMGRLNDVVICVFTEFGRNTFENSTQGTDHGHGTIGLVLGGRVNGGVHGPDYTEADFASKPWLNGEVDFREVLSEIVGEHMGVDRVHYSPKRLRGRELALSLNSGTAGTVSTEAALMRWFVVFIVGLLTLSAPVLAEPARITISYPTEGMVLTTRNFTLLYVIDGDLTNTGLDHVHWQLEGYDNNTAPDLSGVVDVAAARDGNFKLTVYMATPEHLVINEKAIIHFRILTQGAVILAPEDRSVLSSSDLVAGYTMYGNLPEDARLLYSLDGAAELADSDGDGTLRFEALADGAHTLSVRVLDANGAQYGDIVSHTFTVASPLSLANAKKAHALAVKAAKASRKVRLSSLKKLRILLLSMQNGGTRSAASQRLTRKNVTKALSLTKKAEKSKREMKPLVALLLTLTKR